MVTNTTRILVTRTARLRAWARGVDWFAAGSLAALAALILVGMIRAGAGAPQPIILIATPTPRPALARHAGRPAERAAPAALRPPATAAPPPSLPTEAPIAVMAAPAPDRLPDAGAPAAPTAGAPPIPTAPITVIARRPDGSVFSQWACQPYGDWRDSNPMYAHPECQQQGAPSGP